MPVGRETRSWFKSPEARASKQQQRDVTAAYLAGDLKFAPVDPASLLTCRCRSFERAHGLEAHKKLRNDWDWRTPAQRVNDTIEFWNKSA